MTTAAVSKRHQRRSQLLDLCDLVNTHEEGRSKAVARRNALLAKAQGPIVAGGFTYSELAEITGLTRTRVAQIIRAERNKGKA